MRFSYYKTVNRTAPCGVVQCDAILLTVRCGYSILRAVLVRFLRFGCYVNFLGFKFFGLVFLLDLNSCIFMF